MIGGTPDNPDDLDVLRGARDRPGRSVGPERPDGFVTLLSLLSVRSPKGSIPAPAIMLATTLAAMTSPVPGYDRVFDCELMAVFAMRLCNLRAIYLGVALGACHKNVVVMLRVIAEMVMVLMTPICAVMPAIGAMQVVRVGSKAHPNIRIDSGSGLLFVAVPSWRSWRPRWFPFLFRHGNIALPRKPILTITALGIKAVATAGIGVEFRAMLPRLAADAALLIRGQMIEILINRQAEFRGGNLHSADSGLSHRHSCSRSVSSVQAIAVVSAIVIPPSDRVIRIPGIHPRPQHARRCHRHCHCHMRQAKT
jgi:hypothetical protein